MHDEIISIALKQGIWASVAVTLIFYILKTQEARDRKQEEHEEKYQKIIGQLTNSLNIVKDLQKDVKEIKNNLKFDK